VHRCDGNHQENRAIQRQRSARCPGHSITDIMAHSPRYQSLGPGERVSYHLYGCAGMVQAMSGHDHPVNPERVARVRDADPGALESQSVASLLTLLADPLRARILSALLVVDELCVGDLALALDATEDAVTYALRILRTAGLVKRRREGRMAYYRLSEGPARSALAATLETTRQLVKLHPELGAEDDQ